ncbi:conserved hypothetical protein [Desulfarculales bacterium]
MDNVNFGAIMAVVGMGGTLLYLWLITLVNSLMKKLFTGRPRPAAASAGGETRK